MQSVLHAVVGPAGPEKADMTGKIAIVTGGALGIGKEVSRFFARYGCHVIMINRKEEQGNDAIEDITEEVQKEGGKGSVEWVGCDLGDMKQVKEVFSGLAKRLDRLDYVCSSFPPIKQWCTGKIVKYLTLAGGRSPEQGSYSALYAALSPEVVEKEWNGVYLSDPGTLGGETAQGQDLNLATALWELSERMTKRMVGEDALNDWSS